MPRAHSVVLAVVASLPLIACDTPPPGVRDAAAWQLALEDCRRIARLAYGYGDSTDLLEIGRPSHFIHDTSWEIVDPCMKARGFPPPP